MRFMLIVLISVFALLGPVAAQDSAADPRASTGGAQTLEDILARQAGQAMDDSFRSDAIGDPARAASKTDQLGTLGGVSDPELWRALRYGKADITTQSRGPAAKTLIQDGGMWWLEFRQGPLLTYGSYLLGGTLLLLALFYLIRGRIRIDGEKTGRKIERFKAFERFGHWLLASSFLVLGLTGLISLFGRKVMIPTFGHDAFSTIAIGSKWVHNNISWAFIVALVIIFVVWVVHNLPDRTDLNWLAKGGGIFSKGHPPAKKFNAGQKLIFWSVIILGGSISLTGLSLLFPFDLQLFGPTFAKLNAIGAPGWFGMADLSATLSPQEEMQFAQLWHAIVSLVLIAIVFAHIYIGSVGMEGAFDAMGTGQVEEQWAREHHSLWVDEVTAQKPATTTKEA
ncbi:formate dehydrogenase gamma subunit [Litoreibacter halocynthiae]|uniref:Formate dehydrogenase gamma subunit n=1 Tax=Litoreibacter halocynthiae TaxID=1242689 RepID=A0A4R7LDG7_9RHOB|nr:formate dehydrogenase subunit gamma [Litoreibacter halocynthiae]TDT73149.1 formate dehydrogenase gamma subunit [Litoreibacter halocynthiae]